MKNISLSSRRFKQAFQKRNVKGTKGASAKNILCTCSVSFPFACFFGNACYAGYENVENGQVLWMFDKCTKELSKNSIFNVSIIGFNTKFDRGMTDDTLPFPLMVKFMFRINQAILSIGIILAVLDAFNDIPHLNWNPF